MFCSRYCAFTFVNRFACSLAIRPLSSILLLRKAIVAPIAAIVAPIAANKGFAVTKLLTASAADLKPFATPLRIPIIPLPDFLIPSFTFITFAPDFSKLLVDALTDANSACACFESTSIFIVFLSGIELISDLIVSIFAISAESPKSEKAFFSPSRLFKAVSMAEKPCITPINNVTRDNTFCTSSSFCPNSAILALTALIPPTSPIDTLVKLLITCPKSLLLYFADSCISTICCCVSASCFATRLYSTVPCSSWESWSFSCLICCLKGTNVFVSCSTFF